MDVPVIGARPALQLPPWTLLGYRADGRPIYNLAGGSGEDDDADIEVDDGDAEDEGLDDEEPDEDDAGDGEQPPKPTPPKKNAELERAETELAKTRAALKKANEDAKRHRLALKDREAKDRANEGDHERALREAREEAENRWKPRIINQAARAALVEAGASGGPARLLKLLDLDALSVDDDGDVIGLDTEIARLRDEYEELFAKPEDERPKPPKARPTGAPKPPSPERPKNSWDRHAQAILQGQRR